MTNQITSIGRDTQNLAHKQYSIYAPSDELVCSEQHEIWYKSQRYGKNESPVAYHSNTECKHSSREE